MPLILPSAALLVVLNRPGAATPPRPQTQQADPTDTTKKKDKDQEPKKPKTEYPFVDFKDHPSLHLGKGSHIDFRARIQEDVTRSDAVTTDAGEFESVDIGKRAIGVSGEIANAVEFQIERTLTGSTADRWRDVYAEF